MPAAMSDGIGAADAADPQRVQEVSVGAPPTDPVIGDVALVNGTVAGLGPRTVVVTGSVITAVLEPAVAPPAAKAIVDLTGKWLAPSFIDSHVHALYRPGAGKLAKGGLGAVVDQAAPLTIFGTDFSVGVGGPTLEVLAAGPMVTAIGGYPTRGWGAGGYGVECADLAAAVKAVDQLKALGAGLVKVPMGGGPVFDGATLEGIVAHAHAVGLKASTHAMGDASAAAAAVAAFDVLAHTPTQPLSSATVQAWSARAVISTLAAFGGAGHTLANLRALKEAGAKVLYGTDYGNTGHAGIDPSEIALLQSAGLSAAEILAAGTSTPADFWGLSHLGAVAVGKRANLLVLAKDPLLEPVALAAPVAVYLSGVRL